MTRRSASVDLATAYHEAGHAVAAWNQHVGIRHVSIAPTGDAAGYVHHTPPLGRYNPEWDRSPQVRLRGERLIRICLAGPAAQRKFNPRSWRRYHGSGDYAAATDMILRLASAGEHADTYMRLLEIEAQQIVDRWWAVIEALAAELVRRRKMNGRELTDFIQGWVRNEVERQTAGVRLRQGGDGVWRTVRVENEAGTQDG